MAGEAEEETCSYTLIIQGDGCDAYECTIFLVSLMLGKMAYKVCWLQGPYKLLDYTWDGASV